MMNEDGDPPVVLKQYNKRVSFNTNEQTFSIHEAALETRLRVKPQSR